MIQEESINWSKLIADIGGKSLVNRISLLYTVPFLIAVSVLSSGIGLSDPGLVSQDPTYRYFTLVLANVASIFVCWLYLELIDRTLFRKKAEQTVNIFLIFLFGASIGWLKGWTTGFFSWVFGSETSLELAVSTRVVQTTMLGITFIPLLALVTATLANYQLERQVLLAERIEESLRGPLDPISERASKDLREFIEKSKLELADLKSKAPGASTNALIAKKLRLLVDEGLRPLTQRIWDSSDAKKVKFSIFETAQVSLIRKPFPITVIGIAYLLGLLPIHFLAYEPTEALLRTALYVSVAVVVFASANMIPRTSVNLVLVIYLGANIVVSVLGPVTAELVFGDIFGASLIANWASLFLWLSQLTLFASIAREVVTGRAEIRKQLVSLIGDSKIDAEARAAISLLNNRELAQYVHGNIQNELLSSALAIESKGITSTELLERLREVEAILDGALGGFSGISTQTLMDQLEEIRSRWRGFVRIDFDVQNKLLEIPEASRKLVVQVVSEGVSNAIRHGLAKSIQVSLLEGSDPEGSVMLLSIRDDGLGPRAGKPGLGTELYKAISKDRWSIDSSPNGGSVLQVRIPS